MALTEDNKLLLKQTLHQIETEPESWDQETWGRRAACGTVACFAGHAVMLRFPSEKPPVAGSWVVNGRSVEVVAGDLLGLSKWHANVLFNYGNDLDALSTGVQVLLDTDGEIDPDVLDERMHPGRYGTTRVNNGTVA